MIAKEVVTRLNGLPIEEVAERLGMHVERHVCLCPFHDDHHPSLTMDRRRNRYHCFACGAQGSVIDLTMKLAKLDFSKACEWLADNRNRLKERPESIPTQEASCSRPIDTEYLEELLAESGLNEDAKHFLYEERRLKPEVVERLGIKSISSPKPCRRGGKPFYDAPSLLIPYRNVDGRLMTVQGRYLGLQSMDGQRISRFKFPSGSRCSLYNVGIIKELKPGEELFISEGVTDCMALLSTGMKAIAIPSATMLKEEDFKRLIAYLKKLGHEVPCLHIIPDNDLPGRLLYERLHRLYPLLHLHPLPPGIKDFGEWYKNTTELRNKQNLQKE